jgi:hypothetical protein
MHQQTLPPNWNDFCSKFILFSMEKALTEHSASALRILLIKEIRDFIERLDHDSAEDLQKMKNRLKEIFNILTEKEQLEMAPILWGKNSSKNSPDSSQPDQDISPPADLPVIDLFNNTP